MKWDDEVGNIFAEFAAEVFGTGSWTKPPETVPLRILGLESLSVGRKAVQSAFRARVIAVHPDLSYAFDNPAMREAAQAGRGNLPEIRELVWARDMLFRIIPEIPEPGAESDAIVMEPVDHPLWTPTKPVTMQLRNDQILFYTEGDQQYQYYTRWLTARVWRDERGYTRAQPDGVKTDKPWFATVVKCPCGREYAHYGGRLRVPRCQTCDRAYRAAAQRRRRRRARPDRTCSGCGEPFSPSRSDTRSCSSACRQRAYRLRHRGRYGNFYPDTLSGH